MRRIIIILSLCLLLTGCGTKYEDAEDTLKEIGGGYFTLIKEWNGENGDLYKIVYANDSKVKYLMWFRGYRGGITPLYNADGSLQVYGESGE